MIARMTTSTRARATKAIWKDRVEAWSASGASATEFAREHGLAASTLRWWSSHLKRAEAPRFVQLVPKTPTTTAPSDLVVEVGVARVRVAAGFDAALLSDVVRALGGAPP